MNEYTHVLQFHPDSELSEHRKKEIVRWVKEMHENYSQMVEDIIEDVRLHEREDEWGRGGK